MLVCMVPARIYARVVIVCDDYHEVSLACLDLPKLACETFSPTLRPGFTPQPSRDDIRPSLALT